MVNRGRILLLVGFLLASWNVQAAFRFISFGDTKDGVSILQSISNQTVSFAGAFVLYPGDLVASGFETNAMNTWKAALNGGSANNGLADKTFAVRGNHDSSNLAGWQSFFNFGAMATTVGATHYSEMTNYADANFSFDYQNSHFVGVDVPGDVTTISANEISWIDQDLSAAEARGLTHAFLFWHGPIYAVGGHCCPSAPTSLITMLNKHPIVSALFHGHEHNMAYVHIDNTLGGVYASLTNEFEELVVGGGGAGLHSCQTGRSDWCRSLNGFSMVDVNGPTVTINFYQNGNNTSIKTVTFTKSATSPQPLPPENLRINP